MFFFERYLYIKRSTYLIKMKISQLLLTLIIFNACYLANAQGTDEQYWIESSTDISERLISVKQQKVYKLDIEKLTNSLKQKPALGIWIPYPAGKPQFFELQESPIMAAALAKKYPSIKTYSGKNPETGETIRLDLSKKGFHAMVYSSKGVFFIDPIQKQDDHYQVYYKKDLKGNPNRVGFQELDPLIMDQMQFKRVQSAVAQGNVQQPSGSQLRTYRIAVSTTGEYAQFHGGTVEDALSAIVTTMNRVNSIYEKEMAVRMVLVANNDQIIFTNNGTDPFTNDDVRKLIDENQAVVDSIIGNDNYDIGHNFSTGAGGLAGLGVVCRDNSKGLGVTGISQPIGDPFDVDYVSHEIGHQFGAPHTFNGVVGSCSSNRSANSAFEPGSGSTIMAYAGICGSDNIQNRSDPYFHSGSLDFMNAYAQENAGNTCAEITETGNNLPLVEAGQGGFTIPINTPFQLNGSATDPDGDQLSYVWEQFDLGPAGSPNLPEDNAPLFRSFSPSTDSFRIFPQISDIINNTQSKGEILPDYARDLNFRLTVRDNQAISGVDFDEISFSVTDLAGPFMVDSISGAYNGLDIITVNWDVNNTNLNPVNAEFVDIYLSTDGGQTFTETILENTDNDGSETIELPNINTNQAKIKVAASNNIFFNISLDVFSITETTESTFTVDAAIDSSSYCPSSEISFTINTNSILNYEETIDLSVSGLSGFEVKFENNSIKPGESTSLRITNLNLSSGEFNFNLNANTIDQSKTKSLSFNVSDLPSASSITFPANGDNQVNLSPTIVWEDTNTNVSYIVEIATDNSFDNIIDSAEIFKEKQYAITEDLQRLSTYFVRVKSFNECGESDFSNIITFETADIICETYSSTDLPLSIASESIDTVRSVVNIPFTGKVESLSITNLKGIHSYISDLSFILESPNGTLITLISNICGDEDNFDFSISDSANSSDLPCPPTDGGFYQPEAALNTLNGEDAAGDWTLMIIDRFAADGGELQSWVLDICLMDVEEPEILSPSSLTANENKIGTVQLNWDDNSDNETAFIIERSTSDRTNFQKYASVNSDVQSYDDANTTGQTQYYYRVKAVVDIFSSEYSNEASITTQLRVPPAPSTITASNLENGKVLIQWTNDTELEEGFILERSVGNNSNFSTLVALEANSFDFIDETVEEESLYFYRVKGFNENGDGNYSDEIQIETLVGLPLAPSNLDFELLNDSTVKLNWIDNADNESRYTVQRSQKQETFTTVARLDANSTTYEETLVSGTYTYRIFAGNSRGNSSFSNEVNFEINLEDGILNIDKQWESKILIYPNPATQIVRLKNDSPYFINSMKIKNSLGQTIKTVSVNDKKEIEINIQGIKSGLYFISLEVNDKVIIKQLIIR